MVTTLSSPVGKELRLFSAPLVLVLEVPEPLEGNAPRHALVAPVVPCPEEASAGDVIVEGAESELGYSVIVLASAASSLVLKHLDSPLGAVRPDVLDAATRLRHASMGAPVDLAGVHRGLPLTGPDDPRWELHRSTVADMAPWTESSLATVNAWLEAQGTGAQTGAQPAADRLLLRLRDFLEDALDAVGPIDRRRSISQPVALPLAADSAGITKELTEAIAAARHGRTRTLRLKCRYEGEIHLVAETAGVSLLCIPAGKGDPPSVRGPSRWGRSVQARWLKIGGANVFRSSPTFRWHRNQILLRLELAPELSVTIQR